MTEAEWLASDDPRRMFTHFRRHATKRKSRLLACGLCETYRRDFTEQASWQAVEIGYRIADGEEDEAERMRAFAEAEKVAIEIDGWHGGQSKFMIPALVVGSTEQVNEIPSRVLAAFDCNFYCNPRIAICLLFRDIFGNPFRPVTLSFSWLTSTVLSLAQQMYDSRDFSVMPILADALQDAGCDNVEILNHCRGPGPHCRGCFVVDAILNKT